jgi:hypothetical protein
MKRAVALVLTAMAFSAAGAHGEESVAVTCPEQPVVATAVKRQSAVIPEDVWAHQWSWRVKVTFRLDREGVPQIDYAQGEVLRKGEATDAEREALTNIARDAFAGYRFCRPIRVGNYDRWTGWLQFVPMPRYGLYGQAFLPTLSRDDVNHRRTGKVKVQAEYAVDGTPIRTKVLDSSGDDELDQKAIGSMLDTILVAPSGHPLPKPVVVDRAFDFRLVAR